MVILPLKLLAPITIVVIKLLLCYNNNRYSTDLRSGTQGKGEFTMEYKQHQTVPKELQENLIKLYATKMLADEDK